VKKMDLTIKLKDTILNIRTAVLIDTEKGYIFEKPPTEDFYCVIGGRVQANETSENAAKREIKEELNIDIDDIKLKAVLECFFLKDNKNYHEIGFYYKCKLSGEVKLPDNFFILSKEEIKTKNILPKIIVKIIDLEDDKILHFVTD